MRILSVELDNIKSYRRQTVQLTPGLNAICGLNGSGKTTILEAIGFALFNHLPYNQASFLREGEKTGTVRVRIEAPDGREYEVVRKVGSSTQYFVADMETGVKLAERGPSVLQWIRSDALGLEGEVNLESLFENAVGVPQGKMTSDFLGSANTRKAVFDPLLRVEEYERAWKDLSGTMSYLRDRTADVREEIARLEAEVERIPALEEELAQLDRQLGENRRHIEDIATQLADVEVQIAVLNDLQQQVIDRTEALRAAEYEVGRIAGRVTMQEEQVAGAERARQAVEESIEGYRQFLRADETLTSLARREQERNARQQVLTEAQTRAVGINAEIDKLMLRRERAIEDGKAAGALDADVARQDELDRRLNEATVRVQEAQRVAVDVRRLGDEITQLERRIEAREAQIAVVRAADAEAARLPQVERRFQEVGESVAGLPALRRQLEEIRVQGQRARKRHDVLVEKTERYRTLQNAIEAQRVTAVSLPALQERNAVLREERIRAQATLEYQHVARAELERQRCPLLDLQCPVVASDGRALSRLEVQAINLGDRLRDLETELAALTPQLDAATSAADAIGRLEVEAAPLRIDEAEWNEATAELERCRDEYGQLAKVIESVAALERERGELETEWRRLQGRAREAAQLQVLLDAQESDRGGLDGKRRDRARAHELLQTLSRAEEEARALAEELRALNDPRGRRMQLRATAAELPSIERQVEESQDALQNVMDKVRALSAELSGFAGLDATIAEQRRLKDTYRAAHDRYLQNKEEAAQLEGRRALLVQLVAESDVARKVEQDRRAELEQAHAAYHPEFHEDIRREGERLRREQGAAHATQQLLSANREVKAGELAGLRAQEERLRERLGELDEIGETEKGMRFVRDTIRAAGPTLTETLLANISQIANDIFAEIMDDHAVELRWDRDYEVLVRRGPEDRKFAQLSGGEQMSAALALRLALLKEMSEVNVAFFDEPTQNMDTDRRGNLADQIRQVKGFGQMIVISHDDTFEHHTDNLVRLVKEDDETMVVA